MDKKFAKLGQIMSQCQYQMMQDGNIPKCVKIQQNGVEYCLKYSKTGQSGNNSQDKLENDPNWVQTKPNGFWNGQKNQNLD